MPALVLTWVLAGTPVVDAARDFSFEAPAGYEPLKAEGGALYAFTRGDPSVGSWAAFNIVPLGGTLTQESEILHEVAEKAAIEALKASGLEPTGFAYHLAPWGHFQLDVMISRSIGGERRISSLAAQVPLARGGIQLQFAGDSADEARLLAELTATIGSLKGKTNWLTDAERSRALGQKLGFGLGLAVVPLVAVVALVFLIRRKRAGSKSPAV